MQRGCLRTLGVLFAAAALSGCAGPSCGGGNLCGGPPPPPPKGVLTISPQSLNFPLGGAFPTPAAVSVGSAHGFGTPNAGNPNALMVTSTDPVHFGATAIQPQAGAASATIDVIPIGGGATATFSVFDLMNDAGTFTATSAPCGRPDILDSAQLLYPPSGATHVPANTSTIYIAGSEPAAIGSPGPYAPPGKLHFVIDNAGTEEGTALTYAPPPPGSATPAPVANSNTYFGSEPMPPLVSNNVYDVYLYDDACEVPFKAGSFST